jgi:SecD/SecF fusion protein
MTDRQRNGLILLIVVGLIAGSAVAISLKKTVLGLDLKGGIELVYQATGTPQNPLSTTTLNEAVQDMDKRVNQLGVSEPSIQTEGKNLIDAQLPNVKNVKQAEQEVGSTQRLAFYDWEANVLDPTTGKFVVAGLNAQVGTAETISQGGGSGPGGGALADGAVGLYTAVKLAAKQTPYISAAHNSRKGPEYFLFGAPGSAACKAYAASLGKKKPEAGTHCLLTGAPVTSAVPKGETLTEYIDSQAPTTLTRAELKSAQLLTVPQGWIVIQGSSSNLGSQLSASTYNPTAGYYVLRDKAALFGNEITNPQETTSGGQGTAVTFGFTSQGKTAFENVTLAIAKRGNLVSLTYGSTLNQHFAAVLGTQVLTVPYIDYKADPDGIDASQGSQITGDFTVKSAKELASFLRLGSLPVTLKQISDTTVSATLGSQALHQGLIAGLIGLAIVVIFLIAFYRLLGVIAVAGLAAYGVYFFALIKLIPITLTLAGMAGLVLTIGVAADANIVIFERVKEEIRAGRSVRNGIAQGYKKGLSAIVDANVVTIMVAFVLFVLSTQDVKGFAFTLGIGTFVSLFTAVMATQAIMMSVGTSKTLSGPAALGAAKPRRGWTFDFMGASKYFFTLSGVILLVGAFAIGGRGLNLGIDFTSGTQVSVGLAHKADVTQVKAVMTSLGEGDATIQAVKGDSALGPYGFQIQSKYLSPTKQDTLRTDLQTKFGIRQTKSGNQDFNPTSVGPTFGSAVEHSAIVAVIISLLLISVYIALRFDWKYAVPVFIALAHDLLISIGVYALTGRVVTTNTVAALLTILGYSMYDTIIVFDRVRENTKRMPQAAYSQIVNRSMSEVLTRSLATTACTLLPVVALLIFGGSTLKDFAFALLVGVTSGAYSSIFIASPVLMHWKEREHGFRLRRERITAEHGFVPAYATGAGADIDPDRRSRQARGAGRLNTASPEAGVSASEFEQMKRDLGLGEEAPATGTSALSRRTSGAGARTQGGSTRSPGGTARGGARRPTGAGGRPTGGAGRPNGAGGGAPQPGGTPPRQGGAPASPAAPEPAAPAAKTPGPSEPVPENQTFEHAPDASGDETVLPNQQRPRGGAAGPRGRNKKHGRR